MYTKKELKIAADTIRQIAWEHHMPEARVRADMEEAMNAGRNDPDPVIRARWADFHYAGAEPTLEEFILWVAGMTNPGRKDRKPFWGH